MLRFRACIQTHGLNYSQTFKLERVAIASLLSQAILLRFQARISKKYATILQKFCAGRWAKESRNKANKASASLSLDTGSKLSIQKTSKAKSSFRQISLTSLTAQVMTSPQIQSISVI